MYKMTMKKNRGQTLIEVVVTLAFIAISVIAIIRLQNYLAYDSSLTQQKADAILLAQQQVEILRDFQVLNNTSGYISYQSIASGSSTFNGASAIYTVTWAITTNASPRYKQANVTVSWTDRNNNPQSVSLVSNVAGIQPANSGAVM